MGSLREGGRLGRYGRVFLWEEGHVGGTGYPVQAVRLGPFAMRWAAAYTAAMASTEKVSKTKGLPLDKPGRYSKPAPSRGGARPGAGRPAGVPNRATQEFRETVRQLLDDNRDNIAKWVRQVADGIEPILDADGKCVAKGMPGNPAEATRLIGMLAEFAAPKLSRSEVTGEGGGALQVIIHKVA